MTVYQIFACYLSETSHRKKGDSSENEPETQVLKSKRLFSRPSVFFRFNFKSSFFQSFYGAGDFNLGVFKKRERVLAALQFLNFGCLSD